MNKRSYLARRLRIVPPLLLGAAALAVVVVSAYQAPPVTDVAAREPGNGAARAWAERVFQPSATNVRSAPQPSPTPSERRVARQPEERPAAPPASFAGEPPSQPSAPNPTPTPVPPTPTPAPSCPTAGMGGYAAALFTAVNDARAANGMGPLAADGCVTYVAQLRSQDMAASGYFAHTSPSGQTAFTMLDSHGVPYAWAGENLARNNYPDTETVAIAIRDLMASDGHRANILHGNYTRIGVGFAQDAQGFRYFTMIFTGF